EPRVLRRPDQGPWLVAGAGRGLVHDPGLGGHRTDVTSNFPRRARMKVLVLGAGFGGLELTTRLSEELGDDVEVVLIDKAVGFVFGFSKLDVMFGRTVADAVVHPYRDLVKPGVRFVQATIESI